MTRAIGGVIVEEASPEEWAGIARVLAGEAPQRYRARVSHAGHPWWSWNTTFYRWKCGCGEHSTGYRNFRAAAWDAHRHVADHRQEGQ